MRHTRRHATDVVKDGIAVDGSGNVYVTGTTESANFPTTIPSQTTYRSGSMPSWPSWRRRHRARLLHLFRRHGDDAGNGIAVDSSGNAYVTGKTTSTNFPTTIPYQQANAGGYDAFVTKLAPAGIAGLLDLSWRHRHDD